MRNHQQSILPLPNPCLGEHVAYVYSLVEHNVTNNLVVFVTSQSLVAKKKTTLVLANKIVEPFVPLVNKGTSSQTVLTCLREPS